MGRRLKLLTEEVIDLKQDLLDLKVGDEFDFGKFEGKTLKWRVLEKTQNILFVILSDCLKEIEMPFDEEGETNDWNKCSLKRWLNSSFFNDAFNSEEKSLIENTSVGKILLLSIEEAKRYFKGVSDRKAPSGKWWWLRSHSLSINNAADVISVGGLDIYFGVGDASGAVRPAMKLEIDF